MKIVTRYKADDGTEYVDEASALARDEVIRQVDSVMSLLAPVPTELNWEGYIQQDEAVVRAVRERLYALVDQRGVLQWWLDKQRAMGSTNGHLIHVTHPSYFCRMLDGGHQPLDIAYTRLWCIDKQFREWNQPYFAQHPEEGKPICRN
jgi:hypothetical protein